MENTKERLIEVVKNESLKTLDELKGEMEKTFPVKNDIYKDICVYASGSLGRLEMTKNSDLDLFFVSLYDGNANPMSKNLNRYLFFANLYAINQRMGFSNPSKDGEYWNFINKNDFLDIGSRKEDFNNSFTTRLLLILESKPIYNEKAYNKLVKQTVNIYFKDYNDHKDNFYPLFLMNDIWRYWYTLTLNYEYRRDNNDDINKKNWKRLKLKYARLITCFSMMACLYHKNITPNYVIECIKLTPLERLNTLATEYDSIKKIVSEIITEYEWFLNLRQTTHNGFDEAEFRKQAFERADVFHNLIIHQLMSQLSQENPELKKKADIY